MHNLKQATCQYANLVERAAQIALIAHAGQTDLDGLPVVLHPFNVALRGKNDNERIVGFLHDVVEDTSYTLQDIKECGFSDEIITTLQLLTHDKSLPYQDYLQCIKQSGNQLAISVKTNDLAHNLERGRAGNHTKQVTKHTAALEYLTSR